MTQYLFICDFDKTLSVDDVGSLLSLKIGISGKDFDNKVRHLRKRGLLNLGGEFAYLLAHDADYKEKINKSFLVSVGREIKLKKHIPDLVKVLTQGINNNHFVTHIISAAPQETVREALKGILPPENIHGTVLTFGENNTINIKKAVAGSTKVSILKAIGRKESIPTDHTIYVGDGLSDMYALLHVKAHGGYAMAVAPFSYIGSICRKTVVSDDALSLIVPVLEDILGFSHDEIKTFFEKLGLPIHTWEKAKVEWLGF